MNNNQEMINRWRLVLGSFSDEAMGNEDEFAYQEIADLLEFLYEREYDQSRGVRQGQGIRHGQGGGNSTGLQIPDWIRKIRRVFPKDVYEKLENEALSRYQISEILNDKNILESLEPNMSLLKNILVLKDKMKADVIETARKIVNQVVEEITKKLKTEVELSFFGKINHLESRALKISKNFDFKKTVNRNLKYYDENLKTIIPRNIYFKSRIKHYNPWNLIICIDQSGSMLESTIYSAIMANIFAKLSMLKVNLVIYDTRVVDLSGYVNDPVEILMNVQLGGGNDTAKAMSYCEQLIDSPSKTLMVMVTDLFEGSGSQAMFEVTKRIIEAGNKLFVLTGMDAESVAMVDERNAKIMSNLGAKVAALTPNKLADWIASVIR